jgi:hypothetical protein
MSTVQQRLRHALETCGQTRYEVSKATGIPQSVLSRFVAGDNARGATIDALANYLGMELRPTAARKSSSKPAARKER